MSHRITSALILLVLGQTAWAGTKVVGMELGVTTLNQARARMAGSSKLSDVEVNHFTRGKRFTTAGPIHGVNGLKEALFVFDSEDKLAGVLLTLDKGQFDRIDEILSKKYREVQSKRPTVGNKIVVYTTEDATIELTAPHMSFSMDAMYVQTGVYEMLKSEAASDEKRRRDIEDSQF